MPRPKKTWGEKMKAKPPHHVILDKDFAGIPKGLKWSLLSVKKPSYLELRTGFIWDKIIIHGPIMYIHFHQILEIH